MAISVSIKKFKGVEYVYICESFRDPLTRKPTSRVLASYGNKKKLLEKDPDAMEKIQKHAEQLRADSSLYSQTIQETVLSRVAAPSAADRRPDCRTCTPAPYRLLWEQLGISNYFQNYRHNYRIGWDVDKTIFFSVVSRLIAPSSKRSSWLNKERFVFDFSDLRLDQIYDSLDILADRKEAIVKKLNDGIGRLYKRDLTIALYDVTTLYFESFIEDGLRRRGMSKEHRTQETQVVLGLLVDADGIPFNYEIFPGNTAEVHTLMEVVKKFSRDYGVQNVTVVADSGLNQYINLEALQESNFNFIVGFPPYIKLSVSDQQKLLDCDGWHWSSSPDDPRWGIKEMPLSIERTVVDKSTGQRRPVSLKATCIATYSAKRFEHDSQELELKWQRASDLVARGPAAVKAAGRSGYKAFIKPGTTQVELNSALYDKRRKWCGYMALLTNLDLQKHKPAEIYGLLRQLWRIENNFRMLKTDLRARPVFVWTDQHIRGHFVLNYIGLLLQRLLMKKLRESGLDVSGAELIRALESMKISRLKGLKKAQSFLYCCSNENAESLSVRNEKGDLLSLQELCDKILNACGIEPLKDLETAESIRRKFHSRLPMA